MNNYIKWLFDDILVFTLESKGAVFLRANVYKYRD